MGRYNRRNSGGLGIVGFILTIMIISHVGDIISFGLDVIFGIMGIAAGIVLPIIFTAFLIKIISDAIKKKKGQTTSYTSTNNNQKTLLNKMNKFFENNSQLNIDDETYLVLTDKNNIDLSTVDIYMRNEYIGTLKDYYNAYPYAFNSLAIELNRYLNRKNKKPETTVAKEEQKDKTTNKTEKTTSKNDCASYIQKFTMQQKEINNEQINNGLNETIEYLTQIKKIEDEFSESKNKTGKLYQYYLPMLNDILANYIRLKKNAGNSSDSKESEDRLLKTIVLINGALKTISSSLVEDYYTEMNVDMRTLESILKKDGLVNEMNKEKNNE